MASKTNLLFVTEVFPFPLDRGQRVRVWNILLACADVGDVTFVAPEPDPEVDRREVEAVCQRVVYAGNRAGSSSALLGVIAETVRVMPGVPVPSAVLRYEPYVAALRQLDLHRFDLIWAERPQMACLCRDHRDRIVLDFDDIEHLKTANRIEVERGLLRKAHNIYRYLFYRRLELGLARDCLASVVCSDQDRDYLVQRGCPQALVVPNAAGAAPPSRAPRQFNPEAPLRAVFLGHLESMANADAIRFLAEEVMPPLCAAFPEVVLDAIGGGARPVLPPELERQVNYRGFVDDLGGALSEYDMLLAPLRFGGGTKLKVLDAMAHGLPVVTTPVGAQGLPVVHEEHALVVEPGAAFVKAVARLKRDPALAARLSENAFALVRDRFSWDVIRRDLAERLRTLKPRG